MMDSTLSYQRCLTMASSAGAAETTNGVDASVSAAPGFHLTQHNCSMFVSSILAEVLEIPATDALEPQLLPGSSKEGTCRKSCCCCISDCTCRSAWQALICCLPNCCLNMCAVLCAGACQGTTTQRILSECLENATLPRLTLGLQ